MANTENIEAKLAAYVDDELDAAGRAEIEKHLASNPQHRVLIEELRQTKQYLRAVPHANAPPEVAEMLAAQLERAALLGDVELGGDTASTSFSRWPQFRAIAAIVLITVALAGVLYYILPSPKPSPTHVAIVLPENPAPSLDQPEVDRDVASRVAGISPAPASGSAPVSSGESAQSTRLLIDTPDPASTNDQVVRFLADNRISWQPMNDPASKNGPTTAESAPQTIVAKMTRGEAEQLSDRLTQSEVKQTAQIIWGATSAPTTLENENLFSVAGAKDRPQTQSLKARREVAKHDDAERELAPGDTIRIRAKENSLPGVEPVDETVTIGEDGAISLPTVGRVTAAGVSAKKLGEESIPQAMNQIKSNLQSQTMNLSWSVERVSQTPATKEDDPKSPTTSFAGLSNAPPTSPPTTSPAKDELATTEPVAGQTSQSTEPRVDVTIVLRPVPAAPEPTTIPAPLPAPAPATLPAEIAPTTSPATAPAGR